jgi:hypothetical protein
MLASRETGSVIDFAEFYEVLNLFPEIGRIFNLTSSPPTGDCPSLLVPCGPAELQLATFVWETVVGNAMVRQLMPQDYATIAGIDDDLRAGVISLNDTLKLSSSVAPLAPDAVVPEADEVYANYQIDGSRPDPTTRLSIPPVFCHVEDIAARTFLRLTANINHIPQAAPEVFTITAAQTHEMKDAQVPWSRLSQLKNQKVILYGTGDFQRPRISYATISNPDDYLSAPGGIKQLFLFGSFPPEIYALLLRTSLLYGTVVMVHSVSPIKTEGPHVVAYTVGSKSHMPGGNEAHRWASKLNYLGCQALSLRSKCIGWQGILTTSPNLAGLAHGAPSDLMTEKSTATTISLSIVMGDLNHGHIAPDASVSYKVANLTYKWNNVNAINAAELRRQHGVLATYLANQLAIGPIVGILGVPPEVNGQKNGAGLMIPGIEPFLKFLIAGKAAGEFDDGWKISPRQVCVSINGSLFPVDFGGFKVAFGATTITTPSVELMNAMKIFMGAGAAQTTVGPSGENRSPGALVRPVLTADLKPVRFTKKRAKSVIMPVDFPEEKKQGLAQPDPHPGGMENYDTVMRASDDATYWHADVAVQGFLNDLRDRVLAAADRQAAVGDAVLAVADGFRALFAEFKACQDIVGKLKTEADVESFKRNVINGQDLFFGGQGREKRPAGQSN